MEQDTDKKTIRAEIRAKRAAMTEAEWRMKSHRVCERIRTLRAYRQADTLCVYLAKHGEVLLDELIEESLHLGKKVAAPRVNGLTMDFYELTSLQDVSVSSFGIREPLPTAPFVLPAESLSFTVADPAGENATMTPAITASVSGAANHENILFFMPAVALDAERRRIGYGGGYYDRYLEHYPMPLKVAPAFDFRLYRYTRFPAEPHDIPPDVVITESLILI